MFPISPSIAETDIHHHDSVVITFTGHDFRWFRDGLGPQPEFRGVLSKINTRFDKVYIVDVCKTWYLRNPITERWNGYQYYRRLIKNITASYKKVVLLGVSMGGYAPLLHADLASYVISISPQVNLDLEVSHAPPLRKRHASMIPKKIRSYALQYLVENVSSSNAIVDIHLGQNSLDQAHIKYLPDNVRVMQYQVQKHAIGKHMRDTGKLALLIEKALKA